MKNNLRKWKKGKGLKSVYLKERKEWRELCMGKEEEMKEALMEQIRNLKNENEIWKFLNGERKRRVIIENNISIEEWRQHFKIQANGSESPSLGKGRKKEEREAAEITKEEIKLAWRRLKKKKTSGKDGISNKAWIYGGRGITEKMVKYLEMVWKGEGIPEDWKTGVIVLFSKKEIRRWQKIIDRLR